MIGLKYSIGIPGVLKSSPLTKSSPLPIFGNQFFLAPSMPVHLWLPVAAFVLQWQTWVEAETKWPAKLTIFISWPFSGKVDRPLVNPNFPSVPLLPEFPSWLTKRLHPYWRSLASQDEAILLRPSSPSLSEFIFRDIHTLYSCIAAIPISSPLPGYSKSSPSSVPFADNIPSV